MRLYIKCKKLTKRVYVNLLVYICYAYDKFSCYRSNQIRVIIFSQGRSGSTLVENLICSTKYFIERGELLNSDWGEVTDPIKYIRGLSKRESSRNFIFHVKIYQLSTDRKYPVNPSDFLKTLHSEGWRIIYLRRKNKIKQAISSIVAETRGNFHKYSDKEENISLSIDCADFASRVNSRIHFDTSEKQVLRGLEYCEIVYEDDLENPKSHQRTINRVLDFMSLEPRPVSTKLRKINTKPLTSLILNYEEFSNCVRENGWQEYLNE